MLACERVGEARMVWHEDTDLGDVDAIVVPGGFSYGDYLRVGAIARFSPGDGARRRLRRVRRPGARHLQRLPGPVRGGTAPRRAAAQRGPAVPLPPGRPVVENGTRRRFTARVRVGRALSIPVKHTTGRYFAPAELLDGLEANGQVVLRYAAGQNPNGSIATSPASATSAGNVVGLMPHPEHAVDPLTGSADGLRLFESAVEAPGRDLGARPWIGGPIATA